MTSALYCNQETPEENVIIVNQTQNSSLHKEAPLGIHRVEFKQQKNLWRLYLQFVLLLKDRWDWSVLKPKGGGGLLPTRVGLDACSREGVQSLNKFLGYSLSLAAEARIVYVNDFCLFILTANQTERQFLKLHGNFFIFHCAQLRPELQFMVLAYQLYRHVFEWVFSGFIIS